MPELPVRLGAIDVGSNALRLLIVEVTGSSRPRLLEQQRVPIRLGHDSFHDGRFSDTTIAAVRAALHEFRTHLEQHGVARYRAVATSAVRESANGDRLIGAVRADAGLQLEAIDAAEEARLVYSAVRRRIALGIRSWLLVDLGGGSLEVSRIDAARIEATESYRLGAVRLIEQLGGGHAADARLHQQLEQLADSMLLRTAHAGLIATGGNIEALARLAVGPAALLPVAALRQLLAQLAPLTNEQRVQRFALRADRADVIVPAAAVYLRVTALAGDDAMHVPGVGVKEGIIEELRETAAADG